MEAADRKCGWVLKGTAGGGNARLGCLGGGWLGKGWALLIRRLWASISWSGVPAPEDRAGPSSKPPAPEAQPGQWVRTTEPVQMKVGQELVDLLPRGTIAKVEKVEGDEICLEVEGKKGWVPAGKVQSAQQRAPGVMGFRLGPVLIALGPSVSNTRGGHFAYPALGSSGKVVVVLDGQEGPEFDGILKGTPVFSPDGRRFAYGAGGARSGWWFWTARKDRSSM